MGFPEGSGTRFRTGAGQVVEALTREGLTRVGADGRAVARIATHWQWTDNGLKLRLTLRPDVILHDDRPLTAARAAEVLRDVIRDPENDGLFTSFPDITNIAADGDHTLVVTVSQHSAHLPEDLSAPFGPASDPPIGTGPYKIARRSDDEVVLERFDKYYLGEPTIELVKVRPVETLRQAWTQFLRGDLDMVTDLPPDIVELVQNEDTQVVSFSRPYQYMVAFNSRRPKFRNPAVRRAMNLAVDRQAIVNNVLHGYGAPATGPIWPKHWAYDADAAALPLDRQLAIRTLEAAGLPVQASADGSRPPARLRFTCLLPTGFSVYERVALELQRHLYEIGVDLDFETVPYSTYSARLKIGDFEAAFVDLISAPSLNRPYIFWRSAREGIGYNVFGYENPRVESAFQRLRASTTDGDFEATTHILQREFTDDPPAIFLAWNERSRAVKRVFGVQAEPNKTDPLLSLWRWGADTPVRTLTSR